MKHRIFGKKLGRNRNERQALFRSQAYSMFTVGAIQTTKAKARALAPLIERLCSIVIKKEDLTARRQLFRVFQDRHVVNNAYTGIKAAFGTQGSNFTQIHLIKRRQGDDALIVKLSFTKPVNFKSEAPVEEVKVKPTPKKVVKKAAPKKPVVKKEVAKKVVTKKVKQSTKEQS